MLKLNKCNFNLQSSYVQKGDTVVWINHDIVAHDVTEETGKAWTS